MAVLKSNIVTDADNPDTQAEAGSNHAHEKVTICEITTPAVVADNDVILLCEVPVDAKITSIRMWSDDLGTTGDFNLGFYPGRGSTVTIATDADAVDEDALGTAIDVNTAALANVEQRFEVANLTTGSDKAWVLAGLTTRPDYGTFFIAFTATEATTDVGDVLVVVRHT